MKSALFLAALISVAAPAHAADEGPVLIGSKKFTESYVLSEIAVRALRHAAIPAQHRPGMGGTVILWQALAGASITAYPEYTGTISEEILKGPPAPLEELRTALVQRGIGITSSLGFNNTYALVMRKDRAAALHISRISDLSSHADLVVGVTHEFLKRRDGWEPLASRYGLSVKSVRGVDHAIGYAALAAGEIDVKDAYSTDARIATENLKVLDDDLNFFPRYDAVFLYRLDATRRTRDVLNALAGSIDATMMTRLNASAEHTKDYEQAAKLYFGRTSESRAREPLAAQILRWTLRHLQLVGFSLILAVIAGVPLGIRASRPGVTSQIILGVSGMIQTIPALALLALLVPLPFFGIRPTTAIAALFLYSLLPIVRNTATGLQEIPASIRESAEALGLPPGARLRRIYLPMAMPMILSGIKTSAVIDVGAATLAALIGAGGLGEPILSGLNLNDTRTILEGAVPAALLAILVDLLFKLVDRVLVPRGLRLPSRRI